MRSRTTQVVRSRGRSNHLRAPDKGCCVGLSPSLSRLLNAEAAGRFLELPVGACPSGFPADNRWVPGTRCDGLSQSTGLEQSFEACVETRKHAQKRACFGTLYSRTFKRRRQHGKSRSLTRGVLYQMGMKGTGSGWSSLLWAGRQASGPHVELTAPSAAASARPQPSKTWGSGPWCCLMR